MKHEAPSDTPAIRRRPRKIAERTTELRDKLFTNAAARVWSRKESHGFTTLPRAMPLVMQIADGLSKGKPVSTTYLELWCRAHDEYLVNLRNAEEIAYHSGFSGQRALSTWRERLRILRDLGFIETREGPTG